MPDWNRILVGDAFALSSRDINFYRDLFLMWPFLACSIVGATALYAPTVPGDRFHGLKAASCAVLIILLAKEKRILMLAASSYVALRVGLRVVAGLLFFRHDLGPYLLAFLVSRSVAFFVIRSLKGWQPSYRFPRRGQMCLFDILVCLAGLVSTMAFLNWTKP
jgi:hypothetical protein